jgi:hypothetical protein
MRTLHPAPLRSRILRPGRSNGLLSRFVRTVRNEFRTMRLVPLHRHHDAASTPAATRPRLGKPEPVIDVVASASRVPPSKSRSVLVVSHHLDGFLRCVVCGLVASRCRSWVHRVVTRDAGPAPRRIPRRQPLRVTAVVAPFPFFRRLRGVAPSSGLVCIGRRCQLPMTRSSLGFVPLRGRSASVGRSRAQAEACVASIRHIPPAVHRCRCRRSLSGPGVACGGYVSGCPAAPWPLADLHEVSDVKERSEERSLRSGHRCHPAAVRTPSAGTVPGPADGGTPVSAVIACAMDFPSGGRSDGSRGVWTRILPMWRR